MERLKRIRTTEPHHGEYREFQSSRYENDMRLKARFESIFEKYSPDFTNVGDEIDLESGNIVVDNGHIAEMRNERDTGRAPHRRLLHASAPKRSERNLHRGTCPSEVIRNEEEEEEEEKEEEEEEGEGERGRGEIDEGREMNSTAGSHASHNADSHDPLQDGKKKQTESSGTPGLQVRPPHHTPLRVTSLEELKRSIASQVEDFVRQRSGPGQAAEPAWRFPDLPYTKLETPTRPVVESTTMRGKTVSPTAESLWVVPNRRVAARHGQGRRVHIQPHARVMDEDEDSELDELSPETRHYGRANLYSPGFSHKRKRSSPPSSLEEHEARDWRPRRITQYGKSPSIKGHHEHAPDGNILPSPVSLVNHRADGLWESYSKLQRDAFLYQQQLNGRSVLAERLERPISDYYQPHPGPRPSVTNGGEAESSASFWDSVLDNAKARLKESEQMEQCVDPPVRYLKKTPVPRSRHTAPEAPNLPDGGPQTPNSRELERQAALRMFMSSKTTEQTPPMERSGSSEAPGIPTASRPPAPLESPTTQPVKGQDPRVSLKRQSYAVHKDAKPSLRSHTSVLPTTPITRTKFRKSKSGGSSSLGKQKSSPRHTSTTLRRRSLKPRISQSIEDATSEDELAL